MNDLVIREATQADKDSILGVHDDVYSGADYLPAFLDRFMACPATTPFVGEINGEVVAFETAYVIDDGQTYISRASRVSPKFQGRGLYRTFSDRIAEIMKSRSGVRRHSFTTTTSNPKTASPSFKQQYKTLMTRNIHCFSVDPDCIQVPKTDRSPIFQFANQDIVRGLFENKQIRDYLFPTNWLIVDWVPYSPLASNLIVMKQMGIEFVSDVQLQDGKAQGLLSTGSVYRTKIPSFSYNIDIYGNDFSGLRNHVIAHLEFLQSIAKEKSNFNIFTDNTITKEDLDKVITSFGLLRKQWDQTSECGVQNLNSQDI